MSTTEKIIRNLMADIVIRYGVGAEGLCCFCVTLHERNAEGEITNSVSAEGLSILKALALLEKALNT